MVPKTVAGVAKEPKFGHSCGVMQTDTTDMACQFSHGHVKYEEVLSQKSQQHSSGNPVTEMCL